MRRAIRWLVAAGVLTLLTVLAWQFRFQHAGNELAQAFGPGHPGWELRVGDPKAVIVGADGVVTISRREGDPEISLDRNLGVLEGARFLRVHLLAKWSDAKESRGIPWAVPRGVIFGKQPDGGIVWPFDHALFIAQGTTGWHREDAVFDLRPDLGEVRFALQHLGESGTLEVKDVSISVVRQRSWFVPVATALTVCWVLLAAACVLPAARSGRFRYARAWFAGMAVIGASWFLVFPQPRFAARTLAGHFHLGPLVTPIQVQVPVPVAPPPVAVVALPTTPEPPPPAVVAEPPPPAPAPVPEKRELHEIATEVRRLDERFNFMHLAAFGALGFAVFFVTGRRSSWPLLVLIAFASEALPNWQQHQPWDAGDIGDLAADVTGISLAALACVLLERGWKRRRKSVSA